MVRSSIIFSSWFISEPKRSVRSSPTPPICHTTLPRSASAPCDGVCQLPSPLYIFYFFIKKLLPIYHRILVTNIEHQSMPPILGDSPSPFCCRNSEIICHRILLPKYLGDNLLPSGH